MTGRRRAALFFLELLAAMKKLVSFAMLTLLLAGACLQSAPAAVQPGGPVEPKHLTDARSLVRSIDLNKTSYDHGKGVVQFTGAIECHTDCSGLVNHVLKFSYGYQEAQLKTWLDSSRPTAARYHDAIVAKTGFTPVALVKDIQPGDFLAIKYLVKKDDTGHIMIASGPPLKLKAAETIVQGTEQWQIKVIDSSRSGHGKTDTRHAKGKDGKDHDGLGEGIFRIYAARDGKIAGYAWSTLGASKFRNPEEEHLVVGRLKPGFKP
jgi:hypothetical protein